MCSVLKCLEAQNLAFCSCSRTKSLCGQHLLLHLSETQDERHYTVAESNEDIQRLKAYYDPLLIDSVLKLNQISSKVSSILKQKNLEAGTKIFELLKSDTPNQYSNMPYSLLSKEINSFLSQLNSFNKVFDSFIESLERPEAKKHEQKVSNEVIEKYQTQIKILEQRITQLENEKKTDIQVKNTEFNKIIKELHFNQDVSQFQKFDYYDTNQYLSEIKKFLEGYYGVGFSVFKSDILGRTVVTLDIKGILRIVKLDNYQILQETDLKFNTRGILNVKISIGQEYAVVLFSDEFLVINLVDFTFLGSGKTEDLMDVLFF